MTQEFAPWPYFADDEKQAVANLLVSGKVNYWTGDVCREFERDYAAYTGRKFAVAVFNGTVALELALYANEIGAGDEVIVTSRTFIASASCAVMRGAVPVVADVDPDSQNVTAATIEKQITPRTRAIICVHLAGWPCDMAPIMDLAACYNLVVIEDCAQAHGARYHGRPVGALGHIAAFSFCQDKIISTAGEG
ncbi:MAG: aminotransferase, partial [Flavobacterium sp.]|nr:aminotransferase [Flavobacterium sp.]